MLFNSIPFLLFFPVVYLLYLLARRHRGLQNGLLLLASYVFYGWWDWRFCGLILFSTAVDYQVGLALHRTEGPQARRRWLLLSVITNLGVLGFFKYFDFFADSLQQLLQQVGMQADPFTLGLVLPVGISFYTFQSMSYTVDIYRRQLTPTRSVVDFALFVAFFPQLVAGPIERARRLLPQIARPRTVTSARVQVGVWLITWGYFKKVMVADNLAPLVEQTFANPAQAAGLDLLVAAFAFAIQIYGDFSGYTDIARGLATLLGFDLMVNFRLPYFATSPSDFWRRWHVSLSTWLRDYLYIPLGGNRGGTAATCRNLMLTMLLGGLWHGAAWTFVLWGAYHGAVLVAYRLATGKREGDPAGWSRVWRIGVMLVITLVGWVIFRAQRVEDVWWILTHLGLDTSARSLGDLRLLLICTVPLVVMQIIQDRTGDLLAPLRLRPVWLGILIGALIGATLMFGGGEGVEFIYFQF